MDYSSMKVVDLKRELKSRGLSTSGNKDELVDRLNIYTQNLLGSGPDIDGFGESINETDILDEDGVLGEELDYEEEVLKKSTDLVFSNRTDANTLDLPSDVSIGSTNSSLNTTVIAMHSERPLPPRESRNQQKAEKKVHLVRNRSLSLLSESDLKENDKLKSETEEKVNGASSDDTNASKISLKLSSQTTLDRLDQRKRKFNVLNDDDKKAARAARFGISSNGNSRPSNKKSPIDSSNVPSESVDVLKQRAERFGLAVAPVLEKTQALERLKNRAERFGIVSSPMLRNLSEEEKKEARKSRFAGNTVTDSNLEEKKKLRAQRFNIV